MLRYPLNNQQFVLFRLRLCGFGVLVMLLLLPARSSEDGMNQREDRIKAALVYKVMRFVHWPPTVEFRHPDQFTLCDQGGALGGHLVELSGRQVGGLAISVITLAVAPAVGQCQAVFIAHGAPQVMNGTLTFSDVPGFAAAGGMIGLVVRDNRVVIEINLRQARRAGLEIDAPLLSIASLVGEL